MSLPENDPHVQFLIRDSWYSGVITGLLSGGVIVIAVVIVFGC